MNSISFRALGLALLLGSAAAAPLAVIAAAPAAAATIKTPAVGKALQEAQTAAKSGDFKTALSKAREARGVSGITPSEADTVDQLIAYYASQAGDSTVVLAQYDKMIADGKGNRSENIRTAAKLALQLKNPAKSISYLNMLGGATNDSDRALMAQAYYESGNTKQALATGEALMRSGKPSRDVLGMMQLLYYRSGNTKGREAILEQMVANYPSPQSWHDALSVARRDAGSFGQFEVYRLRLAVGDLKTPADYSEMAQIAIQMGVPKEAKDVLDKAKAAKLLNDERSQRLIKMTDDYVAKEPQTLAQLEKDAAATKANGELDMKLASVYASNKRYKEAEAAARTALQKGNLRDEAGAKIVLAHILADSGRRDQALQTLGSIPKNADGSSIARLWAIYMRR